MQSLFIDKDEEFVVNFSVAVDKEGVIFCDLDSQSLLDSLKSLNKNIDDFTIEEYHATFKKPSFGDSMSIYSQLFKVTDRDGISFNPVMARYNKIVSLIKSWNLKGKEEKPTEEEIRQLHPIIASAISISLDFHTGGIFE